MRIFRHCGDLGDILSSLPVVRQMGGGTYLLTPYPHRGGGPREPMTAKRAAFLIPLIKAQSYIADARFEENPEKITHDFADLRIRTRKDDSSDTLTKWHANHLELAEDVDTSPWIQCRPNPAYAGKAIFARSERYNSTEFPWGPLLGKYRGSTAFIGYSNEAHKILTLAHKWRSSLPVARFDNALEMASIIAAGKVAVMNQSFPLWVALGLGKDAIVSCWKPSPDVRIPRPNVTYFFDRQTNREFLKTL